MTVKVNSVLYTPSLLNRLGKFDAAMTSAIVLKRNSEFDVQRNAKTLSSARLNNYCPGRPGDATLVLIRHARNLVSPHANANDNQMLVTCCIQP